MKRIFGRAISFRLAMASTVLLACSFGAVTVARASNLLGFYVGAAYGQSHVAAQFNKLFPGSVGGIDSTDSAAFQGMIGIRAISLLGAEIDYMDFGQRSGFNPGPVTGSPLVTQARASQKGEAAFAMLYLPIPIIDVYVKAGLSRITTDMSGSVSYPFQNLIASASHSFTDTGFAYGAGVQWKLGSWAVRGEYERFDAAGANPSLLSIGMTYWFF